MCPHSRQAPAWKAHPKLPLRTCCLRTQAFAQAVWAHPGVLVLSVVVMLVALGLGLVAVLVSAKEHEEQERHEVLSWASGLANHISQTLEVSVQGPCCRA